MVDGPKLRLLAGNEIIEARFTVENLLDIVRKVDDSIIVSANQYYGSSLLRGFCQRSDLGCELLISINASQPGMSSRVGNLRDWLAGERPNDLVWITYSTEYRKQWSERVVGAHLDNMKSRLLLDT